MPKSHNIYLAMTLVSAMLMAAIGPLARWSEAAPEVVTFYRVFIGAACIVVLGVLQKRRFSLAFKPTLQSVMAGVALTGFMVAYVKAVELMPMAEAVMIMYLAPLLAAVGAYVFFGEKLTGLSLAMVGLALAGFVLMIDFDAQPSGMDETYAFGLMFALTACLSYTSFILINRRPSKLEPIQSTLVQLSVASLLLAYFAVDAGIPEQEQWLWLVLIGVGPGFLAMVFAVQALSRIPAVTYGTLAYMEPLTVAVLAWGFFGEVMNTQQLIGAACIILAGLVKARVASKSY
ncbi:MAG: DMT family transporter [Halieaceae bacterium]|nr:DMT family transporter [Halieaceae bacterium]